MYREELLHSNDLGHCLPGHRLTNVFRVVSREATPVSSAIESHLKGANGCIERWTIVRTGDVLEHKITVTGLSEREARELRDKLRSLDGSLKTHLEHLLEVRNKGISQAS
ncbi:hypothetical protein [Paraburkholderia phenoliruptrix]|nr:hypothetical protein [Paraburkholderia phenoliruptrix]